MFLLNSSLRRLSEKRGWGGGPVKENRGPSKGIKCEGLAGEEKTHQPSQPRRFLTLFLLFLTLPLLTLCLSHSGCARSPGYAEHSPAGPKLGHLLARWSSYQDIARCVWIRWECVVHPTESWILPGFPHQIQIQCAPVRSKLALPLAPLRWPTTDPHFPISLNFRVVVRTYMPPNNIMRGTGRPLQRR